MKKRLFQLLIILISSQIANAQFGPEIVLSEQSNIYNIQLVDMDNDNLEDVVISKYSDDELVWLKNLGNGLFGEEKIIQSVFRPLDIYFEDFDGDNDLDFTVKELIIEFQNNHYKVNMYKNTPTGYEPYGVIHMDLTENIPSDIDNDGDTDFVGFVDNLIIIRRNDGPFMNFVRVHVDEYAHNITDIDLTDINGDGLTDIVASLNGYLSIVWYENLGNCNFSQKKTIGSNTLYYHGPLHCVDYDKDNDNDVLCIGPSFAPLSYYKNDGADSNFVEIPIIHEGVSQNMGCNVIAEDFDNDGDMDIVYGNKTYSEEYHQILYYNNLGNNTLSTPIVLSEYPKVGTLQEFDFVAKDFDKDGDKDLFCILSRNISVVCYFENLLHEPYRANGNVFFDENMNGEKDSSEYGLPNIKVQANSNSTYTYNHGNYSMALEPGIHTIKLSELDDWALTSQPESYTISITEINQNVSGLNFGLFPANNSTHLQADISYGFSRCDDLVNMWLSIKNNGTSTPNGLIELILDDSISFIGADIVPDSILGQAIYWHFDSLFYWEREVINAEILMPDFNSIGDTLVSIINCYEIDKNSNLTLMDADTLSRVLLCSYDPNDKVVFPKSKGSDGIISANQELSYTIRFQNTGNDTAFNIHVIDTMDSGLDINTFEFVFASHPVVVNHKPNNVSSFYFENILLPDSNTNEMGSHGLIKFKIKPSQEVIPNQQIENTAFIYFDNNPPVSTNTTTNIIECPNRPQPTITYDWPYLYCDLSCNCNVYWYLNDTVLVDTVSEVFYPTINGAYSLTLIDTNYCSITSNQYVFNSANINDHYNIKAKIFPNPSTSEVNFLFNTQLSMRDKITIYSITGAKILTLGNLMGNSFRVENNNLGKGIFIAYLENDYSSTKIFLGKLVVE